MFCLKFMFYFMEFDGCSTHLFALPVTAQLLSDDAIATPTKVHSFDTRFDNLAFPYNSCLFNSFSLPLHTKTLSLAFDRG